MKIIPYVLIDGARSIPDSVAEGVYNDMVEKGLARTMFFGGRVTDAKSFLQFLKTPSNVVLTVWNESRIQAMAWLNNFGSNYAFGHFCFWPETWGKSTINIGKQILDFWFGFKKGDGEHLLDVILGFTPASNRLAIRFIKKIGLTAAAEIPDMKFGGDREGAVISYIRREDFNGRQR